MFIRAAFHAGIPPLTSPINADAPNAIAIVPALILKPCKNNARISPSPTNWKITFAAITASTPPNKAINTASESINVKIIAGLNPSAFITATSVNRSRADIAIVFAPIRVIVNTTTNPIPLIKPLTFPSIEMKPAANAASVSVLVGAAEFLNRLSISSITRAALDGESILTRN